MGFAQETPQAVFRDLQADVSQTITLYKPNDGVATVTSGDENQGVKFIFFTKRHWAYPSVVRLRRVQQDGVWATRTAYLCAASAKRCATFQALLATRITQIAVASEVAANNESIRNLAKPLPEAEAIPDPYYWIQRSALSPDLAEYDWRNGELAGGVLDRRDAGCHVVHTVYGPIPEYPATQFDNRVGGRAMLTVLLDGTGKVIDADVNRSSGYPDFDRVALGTVALYRFQVTGCQSKASRTAVVLPFIFEPANVGVQRIRDFKGFDGKKIGY